VLPAWVTKERQASGQALGDPLEAGPSLLEHRHRVCALQSSHTDQLPSLPSWKSCVKPDEGEAPSL